MKCKFAYIILLILLIIISASQIYATEEVTITYPEQGEHYNNITFFNGNITAGEYPIVVGSNVEYRLNCTDTNNSYYYQSSGDLWLENLGDEWNSVDYEGILQYENTTWTATENQIPPEFIDGSCILTMRVKPDGGDYFYSDNITFIFDPNPPEITYSSPADDTWTNEDQPSFTFTAIDEFSSTMSCELIIEGEGFGVNSSVSNNTATTIPANHSVMEEMEGINNAWYIECSDQAGNIEAPDEWIVHFDQTEPSIDLNSPDNNLSTSNSSITFNWTVRDNWWHIEGNVSDDNLTTMLSCNLNINNVINATLDGIEDNVINYSSNISYSVSFDDGTYYWNVTCTDNATNSNTSDTHSFTIDSVKPIINSTHPINDQFINTLDINFSVNSTGSELKRVHMTLNGVNSSYYPTGSPPLYDITCNQVDSSDLYNCNYTTSLSDGTYQANITAWDNMDNNITYSLNFTLDTTEPIVNMINSSFNISDNTPTIFFNYSDTSSTASCTLYFDNGTGDVAYGINSSAQNYTNTGITVNSTLNDDTYTVYVNCTDTAGNKNNSDDITVTIDTTAPGVTFYNASRTSSSATVNISSVNNSDLINYTIWYSTNSSNLSSTKNNNTFRISHLISLTSLSASTRYYYNISVCDRNNNCNISGLKNFTTSAAATTTTTTSSSSGTTVTSFWTTTYTIDNDDFQEGYSKSLAHKKRLKVYVDNETHYVGVVNLTNTTATINVSSEVQQEVFNIGDTHKFEVTNDGYYDIEVKLNNIYDNKANITITSIHEEIVVYVIAKINETIINNQENQTINITNTTTLPKDINDTKEDNMPTIPAKEKTIKENLYLLGLIIILIVVYIIIKIIREKTKKKKDRLDINNDGRVDEKDVNLAKKVIKFYKNKKKRK